MKIQILACLLLALVLLLTTTGLSPSDAVATVQPYEWAIGQVANYSLTQVRSDYAGRKSEGFLQTSRHEKMHESSTSRPQYTRFSVYTELERESQCPLPFAS